MKKIGIIGLGSMGTMLANGFIETNAVQENCLFISNRSIPKLEAAKKKWPTMNIGTNKKTAKNADILFICVKPLEVKQLLAEIQNDIRPETHVVSIAGCVRICDIEQAFAGAVSKVIPTIVSEVKCGVSLICHGKDVETEKRSVLDRLLSSISQVKIITEENFEAAADITTYFPRVDDTIFSN
jgi:pyrroline-5-carboxylate reductase